MALDGTEQVGWWQVGPLTGRTFDHMENGSGFAPMGEIVIIIGSTVWRATYWDMLMAIIGLIVGLSSVGAIATYPR